MTANPVPSAAAEPLDRIEPQQLAGILDLMPTSAAIAVAGRERVEIRIANRSFRRAGLGGTEGDAAAAPIGPRIAQFLAGDALREDFPWQSADTVDTRHYRVTLARTAPGEPACLVTLVDHTSELRTEDHLRREMMTDGLTGLFNRAGFSDRLEAAIGGDEPRPRHAVLVVDLDRFSRINACLGSIAGDELLVTVARRLKRVLRPHDILARTGGDEFGVLLTLDDGGGDAAAFAARIQGALAPPFMLADFEIRITCSIGMAIESAQADDAEEMIRHARFAMKRSKVSGRAEAYRIQEFDILRRQFGMETALRRAIDRGQMRLIYQPIYDLGTGRIVSFESLARWGDEAGNEFSPRDFIPLAEETGLIVPLGRWVIEEAARTLADWDRRAGGDCGVTLSVNLSAIQLQRDAIAPVVERALATSGLDGARFTLELTESALVTDPDRIAGVMHALKGLGTTLAMDDFGTGYSNLAYLQKLPIDMLKIDRSFVSGMLADRDKIAIVRAILSLAQALEMRTTAEGIETNELAQTLAALGCTYGQGFVYAQPLEPDAAYSMLEARRN